MFSNCLFSLLMMSSVSMIGSFYMLIDQLMRNNQNVLWIIHFFFAGVYSCFPILIINWISDQVKSSLLDLKLFLKKNLRIKNPNLVCFDDVFIESFNGEELIYDYIDNFEGFDGMGFVKFGRPLISSILIQLLTYLIILMQFRLSDNKKSIL